MKIRKFWNYPQTFSPQGHQTSPAPALKGRRPPPSTLLLSLPWRPLTTREPAKIAFKNMLSSSITVRKYAIWYYFPRREEVVLWVFSSNGSHLGLALKAVDYLTMIWATQSPNRVVEKARPSLKIQKFQTNVWKFHSPVSFSSPTNLVFPVLSPTSFSSLLDTPPSISFFLSL